MRETLEQQFNAVSNINQLLTRFRNQFGFVSLDPLEYREQNLDAIRKSVLEIRNALIGIRSHSSFAAWNEFLTEVESSVRENPIKVDSETAPSSHIAVLKTAKHLVLDWEHIEKELQNVDAREGSHDLIDWFSGRLSNQSYGRQYVDQDGALKLEYKRAVEAVGSSTRKPHRNRKRQDSRPFEEDKLIFDLWASDQYTNYEHLARSIQKTVPEIKRAVRRVKQKLAREASKSERASN